MLDDIFYWLFNMSIIGGLSGLVVLLFRKIRRIPRRVICILWAIPFLRFTIPVFFGGRYSLMSLLSYITERTVTVLPSIKEPIVLFKTVDVLEMLNRFDMTQMNCLQLAISYFPIEYKDSFMMPIYGTATYSVNVIEELMKVASAVWAVVAVGLITAFSMIYFTTVHTLKDSRHFRDNIYFSEKLDTPAVFGILRPRIIIPEGCNRMDLTYVLLHENSHVKAGDNLWRLVGILIASVHWFNPLSWIFLKCFLSDLELACDERVLSVCDEEEKKKYALSLLDFAEKRTVFLSTFGGARVKLRVENILTYKKITVTSAVAFSLLIIAAAYLLLTNGV